VLDIHSLKSIQFQLDANYSDLKNTKAIYSYWCVKGLRNTMVLNEIYDSEGSTFEDP